jgi:hypothetical protein
VQFNSLQLIIAANNCHKIVSTVDRAKHGGMASKNTIKNFA